MKYELFIKHLESQLYPYLQASTKYCEKQGHTKVSLPLPLLQQVWCGVQNWLNARGWELRIPLESLPDEKSGDQPEKLRDIFLRCAMDEPSDPLPPPAVFRRNTNHVHNLQALWLAFQSVLSNCD